MAWKKSDADVETTAFFMPEGTKGLRVKVERIEFVDGTVREKNGS